MYRKTTLPNGVRVVTSSMDHVRSATLHVNYRVGSRDETDELAGIAHFIRLIPRANAIVDMQRRGAHMLHAARDDAHAVRERRLLVHRVASQWCSSR